MQLRASVPNGSRCLGQNRAGAPCGRLATTVRGYCTVHDPETGQNRQELGRRGGLRSPMTKLRRAVREDDELREQAGDVIRRSMAGDPSVTKPMLDSARALFSYRSSEPPRRGEREPNRHPGRGCYSIIDLLKTADELGILRQLGFVLDRGGLAEYE